MANSSLCRHSLVIPRSRVHPRTKQCRGCEEFSFDWPDHPPRYECSYTLVIGIPLDQEVFQSANGESCSALHSFVSVGIILTDNQQDPVDEEKTTLVPDQATSFPVAVGFPTRTGRWI